MSDSPTPPPIPVICDRCRAEGFAGDDLFAEIAGLLDFTPVPVRAHVNNWTAEVQRAFVAALAITGSPVRAARAIGRYPAGAERLRKARGGSSFGAAWDAAIDLARERELLCLHANMAELAAAHSPLSSPAFAGEGNHTQHGGEVFLSGDDHPDTPRDDPGFLETLLTKYWHKLRAEREARLAGEIAAADFYLRQLTWMEVAIDLTSEDAFAALADFRTRHGHALIDIAETDLSRLLDHVRRRTWADLGEPMRPAPTPQFLLVDHRSAPSSRGDDEHWRGYRTEPPEYTQGGLPESHEAQLARFEERHRRAAEDQIHWEEAARREYDDRLRRDDR